MAEQIVDEQTYLVVLNDEVQYSIWWADRALPDGWQAGGTSGTKQECLTRIGEVWTDMRPLSLRDRMAAAAANRTHRPLVRGGPSPADGDGGRSHRGRGGGR
ncbi:MbtH family protein [Kitasatospora sp. NPDC101155]|uniref:MbtH family protein n=1 Tax=Kitasatospora sp. NPDC101155 TaxID=3364097 RepID=UPI00380AB17A